MQPPVLSEQEPASGPVVYLGQRTALAQRFPRASAALPAAPVGAEGYAAMVNLAPELGRETGLASWRIEHLLGR